jgi:archaellum biogenesis ATPase FlaH
MIKLLLTKPDHLSKAFLSTVKSSGKNNILVLASKPYYLIKSEVNKACSGKECLFLDTVAKSDDESVVYLPAENLTALSIAINQAQQSFSGKVTVIFDSITNLFIKNDISTLTKFFSFILSRSQDWKIDLVFVVPEEGMDEKLLSIIKQSADKVERK